MQDVRRLHYNGWSRCSLSMGDSAQLSAPGCCAARKSRRQLGGTRAGRGRRNLFARPNSVPLRPMGAARFRLRRPLKWDTRVAAQAWRGGKAESQVGQVRRRRLLLACPASPPAGQTNRAGHISHAAKLQAGGQQIELHSRVSGTSGQNLNLSRLLLAPLLTLGRLSLGLARRRRRRRRRRQRQRQKQRQRQGQKQRSGARFVSTMSSLDLPVLHTLASGQASDKTAARLDHFSQNNATCLLASGWLVSAGQANGGAGDV